MLKLITPLALIAAATIAATAYAVSSSSPTDRPDCPGKIVCPLTGDLVCKDRCPLGTEQENVESVVPSCCKNRD